MPPNRLLPYLQLVRLPAVFTAMSNVLAAYLIASGGRVYWPALLLLLAGSSLLYSAGMVFNDYFDLREDARERPYRPLPSARVPLTVAWQMAWLLLASGIALLSLVGITQLWIAALLAGCILFYNGAAKHTPLGPFAMGACRYLNWLLGLSVAGLAWDAFLLALPVFVYVTSLTMLSTAETGARARAPLLASTSGILATAVVLALLHQQGVLPHGWALLLAVAGLAVIFKQLSATYRHFTPEQIQATVKLLVLGIIPLDAILAFAAGPWWAGFAVLGLLVPSQLLARRLYVT